MRAIGLIFLFVLRATACMFHQPCEINVLEVITRQQKYSDLSSVSDHFDSRCTKWAGQNRRQNNRCISYYRSAELTRRVFRPPSGCDHQSLTLATVVPPKWSERVKSERERANVAVRINETSSDTGPFLWVHLEYGAKAYSGALVRVMEMALWSPIISLAFPIMYLSLCPIDCTHWTLSLNRYFAEEKWFVYEQTLPLLSMTAAASLKWIRMRTGDGRAVRSRKFIFRLLDPFCRARARCCFQIGRRGSSTWATKHNIVWRSLILPLVSRMKAISVALYRPMWNPQR